MLKLKWSVAAIVLIGTLNAVATPAAQRPVVPAPSDATIASVDPAAPVATVAPVRVTPEVRGTPSAPDGAERAAATRRHLQHQRAVARSRAAARHRALVHQRQLAHQRATAAAEARATAAAAAAAAAATAAAQEAAAAAAAQAATAAAEKAAADRAAAEELANPTLRVPFTVGSFNVLGYHHTVPGGDSRITVSGVTRMSYTVQVLEQHRVDVVGFQELEDPQRARFLALTGGRWGVWSGGAHAHDNAVAWRRSRFAFVSGYTVPITYFDGRIKQMPVVLLRSVQSGQEIYVFNTHNPAGDSNAGGRAEAVRREVVLMNQLRTTGKPVFAVGDMNDQERFFCPFVGGTTMHSASGGTATAASCNPAPRMRIDWVLGNRGVDFSNYTVDDGALVDRASDHPFVFAQAS